jgi:hypothetical protein
MECSIRKRKNGCRIGFICLILLIAHVAYCQPVRNDIRAAYISKIGVRERTGNNDGKDVELFLRSTGLGKGYPWCAAFVTWCMIKANVKSPCSAYAPDWFRSNVIWIRTWRKDYPDAKPGMVFGLWFQGKNRVAHVGFIDGEDRNNFYTVEGNTNEVGSREGDGVYRKIRPKNSVYIISDYVINN